MQSDGDMTLLAATIMPDHTHLLLRLTERLSIGRVRAKMKSLTRTQLRAANMAWQRNFFEHRLRPDDSANSYAYYIFMNPYRKALIERMSPWPYWYRHPDADFDFLGMLEDGVYPPEEWMKNDPKDFLLSPAQLGQSP